MTRQTQDSDMEKGGQDDSAHVTWLPAHPAARRVLPDISDETLAAMVAEGDRAAFSEIVRRHAGRFFAFACRYTGAREEAEDIVQTAFLKYWQRPSLWDAENGARFTTWFYAMVLNACRDSFRARRPALPLSDDILPAHVPDDSFLAQDVLQSLQKLPDRQRQAIVLCFYEGLTHREAGEAMDVSAKSVELLVRRAKAALKEMLKDE